jgi:hypothetical protein
MVIGGLAVIARGIPRQTVDIDATVEADGITLEELLSTFRETGIVPRIADAVQFARERQVLLLQHLESKTPIDVSLAWLPYERDALARATLADLDGEIVPVVATPDLIVLKAVAWRDQDRIDVERLIVRHHRGLDLGWIRSTVSQFYCLLEEPERIVEFDAAVERALHAANR